MVFSLKDLMGVIPQEYHSALLPFLGQAGEPGGDRPDMSADPAAYQSRSTVGQMIGQDASDLHDAWRSEAEARREMPLSDRALYGLRLIEPAIDAIPALSRQAVGAYHGEPTDYKELALNTAGLLGGPAGGLVLAKGAAPMLAMAGGVGRKADATRAAIEMSDALSAGEMAAPSPTHWTDRFRVNDKRDAFVGAPPGVSTPEAADAYITKLLSDAQAGVGGRDFYPNSGQSIMFHTDGNKPSANLYADSLAATSPDTNVPTNREFANKGYNQAIRGDTVSTGRYPTATSKKIQASADAIDAGAVSGVTGGRKTEPFSDNIALGGGFRDVPNPQPVNDTHHMEILGYDPRKGGGFSDAEHNYATALMGEATKRANASAVGGFSDWDPLSLQAAPWITNVNRRREARGLLAYPTSDYDFAKGAADNYAILPRETVYGKTTGHMPEMLDAPSSVRQAFDDEAAKILYNDRGQDKIALANRALTGPTMEGAGVFEGGTNPGRQSQIMTGGQTVGFDPTGKAIVNPAVSSSNPLLKGQISQRLLDNSSSDLVREIQGSYGLLMGQDAMAGGRFFDAGNAKMRNAASLDLPSGILTHGDASKIMSLPGYDADSMAMIPHEQGVHLVNLGGDPKDFEKFSNSVASSLGGNVTARPHYDSRVYLPNDWQESPTGGSYLSNIMDKNKPQLTKQFDSYAPDMAAKLNELDKRFAKDHGFTLSPIFRDMRSAIAGGGRKGLEAFAKSRGIPTLAVPAMIKAYVDTGGSAQDLEL